MPYNFTGMYDHREAHLVTVLVAGSLKISKQGR